MLEQLSNHIRFCNQRAAGAEQRAAQADEPEKSHYLNLAKWWAHLARSYESAGNLERFLMDSDEFARHEREKRQAVWKPVATAPYDRDLRLAVLDARGEAHALVFPCRRVLGGWIKAQTKERLSIDPSHWQEWSEGALIC
ncbi:MAG TPA: hypothetical protein VMF12_02460 [Xanthobacteraceae bacterium]|nr:hypothetical protein [Xanthobacteraceae bacterium]